MGAMTGGPGGTSTTLTEAPRAAPTAASAGLAAEAIDGSKRGLVALRLVAGVGKPSHAAMERLHLRRRYRCPGKALFDLGDMRAGRLIGLGGGYKKRNCENGNEA